MYEIVIIHRFSVRVCTLFLATKAISHTSVVLLYLFNDLYLSTN